MYYRTWILNLQSIIYFDHEYYNQFPKKKIKISQNFTLTTVYLKQRLLTQFKIKYMPSIQLSKYFTTRLN